MLTAKGLRKRYKQREVVADFGLTLQPGEVVGLLGPNGAGKTTCFYMIVGLVATDTGQILLDGKDITALPMHERARRGVGRTPRSPTPAGAGRTANGWRCDARSCARPGRQ